MNKLLVIYPVPESDFYIESSGTKLTTKGIESERILIFNESCIPDYLSDITNRGE